MIKTEIKTEEIEESEFFEDGRCLNPQKNQQEAEGVPSENNESPGKSAAKSVPGLSGAPFRHAAPKPILAVNRRRLSRLLDRLARAHNWKEASGVLAVLLKGTPRGSTLVEDRRSFRVAMEIHKRFVGANNYTYQAKMKKMYEIWMSKLAWMKKDPKKRHSIQLELALFYLSQGNVQEAHNAIKFLVQDRECREPTVNLIHGLILYQLWYSGLPEDMKIKEFDIHMPSGISDMIFNDDDENPEVFESSSDHDAMDIGDVKDSSRCASESSVGNEKNIFKDCKKEVPRKQCHSISPAHEFYDSGSDMNGEKPASDLHNYFRDSTIFLARGLDKTLLPIRLNHLTGDLGQLIYSYRRLADEKYKEAVEHLRLALYSTPPLLAALLPLIQLLLLGDHVEEALLELERSCRGSNWALPFRLRGRLLEHFHNNHVAIISCYEDALKRDPTCSQSLERLVRMHKIGSYGTARLMETIALHLDAADGNSAIWGELASCFLKLPTATVSDYEDRVSANTQFGPSGIISSRKIPNTFIEGQARNSWKVRGRWWLTRHFSRNAFLLEVNSGNWELLASKAACASHLYGPNSEYVKAVLSRLQEEGDNDHITFLHTHMQNSINFNENLDKVSLQ